MKRMALIGAAALAMALLSGCVHGRWATQTIDPAQLAGKFTIASLTLNADNTYEARAEYGGQQETSKGRYSYSNNMLTFMPEKGPQRAYHAELSDFGAALRVTGEDDGGKWTATLRKQ
ncbi:MAG: copper resistance protein NlpE N-terminal domain-containing protein [Phycisphaerae bacterium]